MTNFKRFSAILAAMALALGAGVEETKDSGIVVVAVLGIMTVLGTAIGMRKKSKR